MRLLPLLIMTGIGFTLGLLCGLLLQLPADGLPADDHLNYRSRRSFAEDSPVVEDGLDIKRDHGGGGLKTGGVLSSSARKTAVQSASEESESNLFVPRGGANNQRGSQLLATAGLNGRGAGQAEPSGPSVTIVQKGEGEVVGHDNGKPSPIKPVTSFTLRLKNTGEKFVVDAAVNRQGEDDSVSRNSEGKAEHAATQTDGRPARRSSSSQNNTVQDAVSGVLWSNTLDESCPGGFQPKEIASWRRKAAGMQVVKMEEGCGRMQNRMVTFRDGSRACARYRLNTDQIQGEVYSYYLAQLLNITHLPPALLLPVDSLSPQWRGVHLQMSMAQWADGRTVVLTRWLDELSPSHIPHELREDDRRLHPTADILGGKTSLELCDLLQWSDLIVFDYLTANLDRMVNNMFNRQWNAEMMNNPAHNLERTKGGSLVFLDNESGLFHGYRLLEKYHGYHEALLSSLCVFRASTARAVKVLHEAKSVGEELHKLFTEGEEHHRQLPSIPEKNVGVLQDRLGRVYDQIVKCEAAYGR